MSKSDLLSQSDKFIELSVDYFCIANHEGYFTALSDNWSDLLGYTLDELKEKPFVDLVHPEDVARTVTEMQELLERRTDNFVNRYIKKDGSIVYLSWRASIDNDDSKLIYAIATDVTRSRKNQELLEITQKTTRTGAWRVDLDKGTCHWDKTVYEIHEVEYGTPIILEEGINYYAEEHRPIITKCVEKGVAEGKSWDVELQIITGTGRKIWVRAIGYPIISGGKTIGLEGVFQDIHDRKQKELEVIRNNAILTATFDSFPSSLVFANTDREIQEVSHHFKQDFGYDISEVKGKTTELLYNNPEDFKVKSAKKFSVDAKNDLTPYEIEYKRKDGSTFLGQTIGSVIKDNNNEPIGFIGAIRDLTAEKQYEVELERERSRLIQASKMSTLGEMAGGIAHEINNPLAIIQGYAQKLEALSSMGASVPSTETKKLGGSLLNAVERMAKIISGLRIFARDGSSEKKHIIKASKVIEETLSFCSTRFSNHDVNLEVNGDTEAHVFCQEIQLSQVLLNLLNNAFDAVMADGVEKHDIEISVESEGKTTNIYVKDWGHGVTEEESLKILEPFFTTKEIGKGTGLGLSISKGIVEDHGGTLSITNLAQPTTLKVSLPNSPSA